MDYLTNTHIEHYTPNIEQLKPYYQIKCAQPECNSIFTNQSNYDMHLEKHHRLAPTEKSTNARLYYCPEQNCVYQYGMLKGKNFKNFKYLRQHYQKVHLTKTYACEECQKAFGTEGQLEKHQREMCGKKFICNVCNWSYDSMEALLTHGKRKGHYVKDLDANEKREGKRAIPPLKRMATKTKEIVEEMAQEEIVKEPDQIKQQAVKEIQGSLLKLNHLNI